MGGGKVHQQREFVRNHHYQYYGTLSLDNLTLLPKLMDNRRIKKNLKVVFLEAFWDFLRLGAIYFKNSKIPDSIQGLSRGHHEAIDSSDAMNFWPPYGRPKNTKVKLLGIILFQNDSNFTSVFFHQKA